MLTGLKALWGMLTNVKKKKKIEARPPLDQYRQKIEDALGYCKRKRSMPGGLVTPPRRKKKFTIDDNILL